MHQNFLEFEKPIAELQAKIEELRRVGTDSELNISDEIERLSAKSEQLTQSIFSSLSAWQVTQLARHPSRPHFTDYANLIFDDFDELHGDRHFSQGHTILAGLARLDGMPVMIIGHEKGRTTKQKVACNFGMPMPEDYRKALRLMQMAERFRIPVLTFIDTPGAYPGIEAEQRNQSEAIARNLFEMSRLKTPIVCTVTGEGGSGGALAIGVGDHVAMLQYSIYSVISPEGCASILWKTDEKREEAAQALGVNADKIHGLGLVDSVLPEPLGGAHRDPAAMAKTISAHLKAQLKRLGEMDTAALLQQRYQRLQNVVN